MGISVQKTNASILYQCPMMLWLLCALSNFAISADGVKSTCNAGSFRTGEEARITCRFEEDINKTQHDVRLFYNTTPVLVIAWTDGSPEIHTKHGYQFDGKINDTLTLEIPDAKLDQAGLYACHIVLSDANDTSPCTLNITGTLYTTIATETCPAICSTSCRFNDSTSNEERYQTIYLVIALIFGAIILCVLCTVIYSHRWKMRKPEVKNEESCVPLNDKEDLLRVNFRKPLERTTLPDRQKPFNEEGTMYATLDFRKPEVKMEDSSIPLDDFKDGDRLSISIRKPLEGTTLYDRQKPFKEERITYAAINFQKHQ